MGTADIAPSKRNDPMYGQVCMMLALFEKCAKLDDPAKIFWDSFGPCVPTIKECMSHPERFGP